MQAETRTDKVDVKKLLGNPKISFVIGAPGSGKGTQCVKLVEEFGYTHISVGDLMRTEMTKGSRDGDRIRQLVEQGKLVPLELTVQVLINALVASPSQNYLIDGFPRTVEQATYFESNVTEAQNVLFYECDEETCIKRCMARAETSGRSDDNQDTIIKRFQAYNEQSKPVRDFYSRFGKVRHIDSNRDPLEIYEDSRKSMLPQISCIIGPKASGKTTLGTALCERTNMKLVNFNDFIEENKLSDEDDETVTTALIKMLSQEICPRVLLEDFPQSEFQAKFFIKNCVTPSGVFLLECNKDACQERMISLSQSDANYQSSSILSKKIRLFNENSGKLLPYLKSATNLKTINTEQIFETAFKQLCACVEPTVLLVRPSGYQNAIQTRKEIVAQLVETQGFTELNIHTLIKDENERHTEIGNEILSLVSAGKPISNQLFVRLLRKIIYSGIEGRNKFILSEFPESREQAQDFEANCSKIRTVIMASGPEARVDLVDNAIHEDSIDSYFQKDNRLKVLRGWDETLFKEQLGNKVDWAIVRGEAFSGSDMVAKMIATAAKGKVVNLSEIAEKTIRPKLATEDGEFEGRIPDAEVEKELVKLISDDQSRGEKYLYLFDGIYHESIEAGGAFMSGEFGAPTYLISTTAIPAEIESRYRKSKEMEDGAELGEEDKAELADGASAAAKNLEQWTAFVGQFGDRVKQITFDTGVSQETLTAEIRSQFCVNVIIVNHEKRLNVDVVCSNLAIKYNMLYLSVYQLIKAEVEGNTAMGKRLMLTKRPQPIDLGSAEDDHKEQMYSAIHFDQSLVIQLVQQKISENRTSQKFVLLEGVCNSSKLCNDANRPEMRFMDEFFAIEKNIGEVSAVINLTGEEEKTQFIISSDNYEEVVEHKEEEKKVELDEDGNPKEPDGGDDGGDDGADKKPVWRSTDYRWTVTNGNARNLPQLCREYMGSKFQDDVKNWKQYQVGSHSEAVVKALDELCSRVVSEESNKIMVYQQVIFKDDE